MGILEISGVSKHFGGLNAISGVSISVNEGETYGLIGTNGAGKTTMFNVICGFLRADEGTIRFQGEDVTDWVPASICRIGIGRCFQTVKPFRSMTPMENVRVARAYGRKTEAAEMLPLDEIIELVGLTEKKDIVTEHLTLPDKKNVEIARALAGNPRLILFDEVSSGLTGKEIDGRIDLMKRLSNMGITIMVVEHIIRFIKEISDRVGVMHAGELICEGTPEQVAKDPRVIEAYLGGKKA